MTLFDVLNREGVRVATENAKCARDALYAFLLRLDDPAAIVNREGNTATIGDRRWTVRPAEVVFLDRDILAVARELENHLGDCGYLANACLYLVDELVATERERDRHIATLEGMGWFHLPPEKAA